MAPSQSIKCFIWSGCADIRYEEDNGNTRVDKKKKTNKKKLIKIKIINWVGGYAWIVDTPCDNILHQGMQKDYYKL